MINEGRRSISFGRGHITQIGYCILFFLSIYSIYKHRTSFSNEFTEKVFVTSVVIASLMGFWEFTSKTTGTHTFPYDFIYNNYWYAQCYLQGLGGMMRLNSTFLEPSYCGGFLAASFWGIMSMNKLKYKWLCILIGLALILNLSGTGIISFLAGIPIFLYLKNKKWGGGICLLDDYYRNNTCCYPL
jgi:hypothetical protein